MRGSRAPRSSTRPAARTSATLCALAVASAATLPYLNALPADFAFDDIAVIRHNPAVRVLPLSAALTYVLQPGAYRPATMLTYAVQARLGNGAWGYHAVNVALHALVSLAVLFLAKRIFGAWLPATAAALLFAVHPIHTEAVTNVVGRAELLAALAVLVALLACARALDCRGWRQRGWLVVSAGAYAVAMLAKESACTAVALIAVLHAWLDHRAGLRARLYLLTPYAVAALAYLALREAVVGSLRLPELPAEINNPLAYVDLWSRVRTAIVVLGDYVGLLAMPLNLSADYSLDSVPVAREWSDPRFLAAAALLASLAALVLAARRSAPVLIVAALFTALPLALTANLLFPIGTIKAERLLYLPSVGWTLACGWLVAEAAARRRGLTYAIFAALLAGFAVRTWDRNRVWRNDDTLFARMIHDAPNSAKAQFNGAMVFERAGQLTEAEAHYRRALAIIPDYADAALGMGNVRRRQGADAGAIYWYEKALRLDPKLAKAHLSLGILHTSHGNYDTAEAALLTGLAYDQDSPTLLVQWSALQLAKGDRLGAAETLARLARIGTLDETEREAVAAARNEIETALQ